MFQEYGKQADDQIAALTADKTALTGQVTALTAQVAVLQARIDELEAEQPTDPEPEQDPNTVTIAGASHTLDGTDVDRGANQLIRYTSTIPTNQYGADAIITGGKVATIVNRINGAAAPAIPAGSYALSGHGIGAGYAGQWLLDHATVGATVTLSTEDTPDPVDPQPSDGSHVYAVWYNTWQSPTIRSMPAAVRDRIGQISLGIAQSAGNGAVGYGPGNGQSVADHAADIRAFVAAGKHVLLGVGGSSDTTAITNDTQVANFVNSIKQLRTTFGFDGLDFDLEPSGSSWTVQHAAAALKQLRALGYRINLTPGLYGEYTAKWGQLVTALGTSGYDYFGPMLYDFPESTDSRLNQVSINTVQTCIGLGVPVEKIQMGYMLKPFTGYQASSPDVLDAAWRTVAAQYPNIGGMYLWETSIDAAQNWVVSNGTGKTVAGK